MSPFAALIALAALALYIALPLLSGPVDRGSLWYRPMRRKRGR